MWRGFCLFQKSSLSSAPSAVIDHLLYADTEVSEELAVKHGLALGASEGGLGERLPLCISAPRQGG